MSMQVFLKTFESPQTRRSYKWMLDRVFSYCEANNIQLDHLSGDLFEQFLDTQAWTANSKYLAYCAIKSYLRFCYGLSSPMASYHMKRSRPNLQRTLSVTQARDLIQSINTSRDYGRRDLSMVLLMVNTGMRAFEVTNALMRYLDLPARRLQILCKGGSWRTVKFSQYTALSIASWLGVREAWSRHVPCQQTVFISKKGHKISTSGIRKLFTRLAARAGLPALSPHDLRRTFATISTQAGASPRIVMTAGGWRDMSSFIRYTQAISPDDLDPYNPVDFILGNS